MTRSKRTVYQMLVGIGALLLAGRLPGEVSGTGAAWQPADAPLMTPWAKDVSPDKVWPEYPRPQMVRPQWVNLNGLWDYAIVASAPIPDASGHKHPANAAGAPVWQKAGGPSGGGALEFSGNRDYLHIPRVVQDDFTIAFWVKTTQKGGTGGWFAGVGLVDGECPGVTDDFGTALVGDRFAFGVGRPDTTIQSTTPINDGRWHHVAAVRVRATGALQVFVDGKREAEGTGGKQALTAPTQLTIGQIQTGLNRFRGSLADVRIFDRPLSAAEIGALSQPEGTKAEAGEGLVGWWRFDQDWR
jgi:Concanavalin A-like lectin/glucanases superfamily